MPLTKLKILTWPAGINSLGHSRQSEHEQRNALKNIVQGFLEGPAQKVQSGKKQAQHCNSKSAVNNLRELRDVHDQQQQSADENLVM